MTATSRISSLLLALPGAAMPSSGRYPTSDAPAPSKSQFASHRLEAEGDHVVAFAVRPDLLRHHLHRHPELQLRRVRLHADDVAPHADALRQIDDRGDIRRRHSRRGL